MSASDEFPPPTTGSDAAPVPVDGSDVADWSPRLRELSERLHDAVADDPSP